LFLIVGDLSVSQHLQATNQVEAEFDAHHVKTPSVYLENVFKSADQEISFEA
jgi:hypothetical protein